MTTEQMSQSQRPHVDINFSGERVRTPGGHDFVTKTTWDPARGAAAAVARAEAIAKAEHQQQLARLELDPTEQRLRGLEQSLQALNARLLQLEAGK